ncbi:MAG TPA: hypothetical protein VFS21_22240 [Roseiflexaceae bacterium]|nr:hypothetical protein [Roseiflexaceae bacterium]
MSNLFAFELAVDVPPMPVAGFYDEELQLWVGDNTSLAGGCYFNTYNGQTCGSYTSQGYTCGPSGGCVLDVVRDDCNSDYVSDWDCDSSLPGPC